MIVVDNDQMRVFFHHDHESSPCPVGQAATPGGQAVMPVGRSGGDVGQAVLVWLAASRPSSAIDVSRILNFWTLPVTVIGNSSVNRT